MQRSIAIAMLAALTVSAPALADVRVPINQTTRVPLRAAAADVMIGNPNIADVNVIDGHTVFLVGKATGVTNLVILDAAGRTIFNDTVVVGSPGGRGGRAPDTVTIARGRTMQDVACAPVCATVQPPQGDQAAAAPAPAVAMPTPASAASAIAASAPAGASSVGSAGVSTMAPR